MKRESARTFAHWCPIVPMQDVLQDTAATLWKKFDEFREGTDFARWAMTVARYQVLYFRRCKRRQMLSFSPAVFEAVDQVATVQADRFEVVRSALDDCLSKLSSVDGDLFRRRYLPGAQVPDIAAELGRPMTTIYSALDRIRRQLIECVERFRRRDGDA